MNGSRRCLTRIDVRRLLHVRPRSCRFPVALSARYRAILGSISVADVVTRDQFSVGDFQGGVGWRLGKVTMSNRDRKSICDGQGEPARSRTSSFPRDGDAGYLAGHLEGPEARRALAWYPHGGSLYGVCAIGERLCATRTPAAAGLRHAWTSAVTEEGGGAIAAWAVDASPC